MKQRDLFYLQKLAEDIKNTNEALNFIKFRTDDCRLYCEASNGICYSHIWEDITPQQSIDGVYRFDATATFDDVKLEQARYLYNNKGDIIAEQIRDIDYPNLNIGKQGLYHATFDCKEIFNILKYTLSRYKNGEKLQYRVTFILNKNMWQVYGIRKDEVEYAKKVPCDLRDSVVDDNFKFTLNAHTLRTILRWHESGSIDFYFHNISGTVSENVVIINPEKLDRISVIRPMSVRTK